jgi:hypothetical protein
MDNVVQGQEAYVFTSQDNDQIEALLSRGVTAGSGKIYKAEEGKWVTFHKDRLGGSTDFNLALYPHVEDKIRIWLLFVEYLYEVKGQRVEQVFSTLAGVRSNLLSRQVNIDFLRDPRISRARNATRRSNEENRTYLETKAGHVILPAPWELLVSMRESLWVKTPWGKSEFLVKKASYLAFGIMMCLGLRVSNLSAPEKSGSNHGIKIRDVTLENTLGIRAKLGSGAPPVGDIVDTTVRVILTVVTTKTGATKVGQEQKIIEKRSPEESQLVEDLVTWFRQVRMDADDYLFTAGSPAKRKLRAKDIRENVKFAAGELGLSPEFFSTSSGRKFFATQTDLACVPAAERNAVAGWAETSKIPEANYSRSRTLSNAFSSIPEPGNKRLSVGDVLKMRPTRGDGR